VVRDIIDQIDTIPSDQKAVDILLHSTGGDALTAWKLMSVFRERFNSIGVLVPFTAFSAATIFCLGADEIIMHPHASLGPIDPQIQIQMPNGTARLFAYEDVGAFLRFLEKEAGITEEAHTSTIIDKLFSIVDPITVGAAKRASELSTEVGERLLLLHMTAEGDKENARSIAEGLNKSFFAHSDAVSRTRARKLKLKIADDNPEIENLIWDAYLGIEEYMSLRKPWNPLQHYLANGSAPVVEPPSPLIIPPNTPQNVSNQLWQAAANQALQNTSQPTVKVDYSIINALVESARTASEYKTSGYLTAARMINGEIRLSATDREGGWFGVSIPDV
jgi:hypothetical protein